MGGRRKLERPLCTCEDSFDFVTWRIICGERAQREQGNGNKELERTNT